MVKNKYVTHIWNYYYNNNNHNNNYNNNNNSIIELPVWSNNQSMVQISVSVTLSYFWIPILNNNIINNNNNLTSIVMLSILMLVWIILLVSYQAEHNLIF